MLHRGRESQRQKCVKYHSRMILSKIFASNFLAHKKDLSHEASPHS